MTDNFMTSFIYEPNSDEKQKQKQKQNTGVTIARVKIVYFG